MSVEQRKLDFENRLGTPLYNSCGKRQLGSMLHHGDGCGDCRIKVFSALYSTV